MTNSAVRTSMLTLRLLLVVLAARVVVEAAPRELSERPKRQLGEMRLPEDNKYPVPPPGIQGPPDNNRWMATRPSESSKGAGQTGQAEIKFVSLSRTDKSSTGTGQTGNTKTGAGTLQQCYEDICGLLKKWCSEKEKLSNETCAGLNTVCPDRGSQQPSVTGTGPDTNKDTGSEADTDTGSDTYIDADSDKGAAIVKVGEVTATTQANCTLLGSLKSTPSTIRKPALPKLLASFRRIG